MCVCVYVGDGLAKVLVCETVRASGTKRLAELVCRLNYSPKRTSCVFSFT